MTWNLAQTMSLIKAAQHKYTHRKLVGRDPKTNRPRYRYYYARHHGGGITSAKLEAGSAFRLTFKGRTGHFHVESVDGDMVTVRHDGRKGSKPIEMSRDELRALLERQHSKLEAASREKAQKRRKSAAKKRKSTKSTKREKTQAQTPREELEQLIFDKKRERAEERARARETMQQAPQQSQTAQAFSSMVDTIKSGERSQAAQDAFKTELNKVIDKAESGTLTDAERAELLPIAEQLVEVTSGRARALMTAVRDQIKGSSEGSEEHVKIASEYVRENRPPKISQQDIDKMTEEQLIEEQRRRRAYLEGASDMAYRKAPSIKELESKISTATKEYGRLNDAMNRGDVSEELFEEARDRLSEAFEEKEQHTRELSVLYKLDEVSNEVSALRVAEIAASRKRVKKERAAARRAAKKRKG